MINSINIFKNLRTTDQETSKKNYGADNGNRTRIISLGSSCFTTKLYLRSRQ